MTEICAAPGTLGSLSAAAHVAGLDHFEIGTSAKEFTLADLVCAPSGFPGCLQHAGREGMGWDFVVHSATQPQNKKMFAVQAK